MSAHDSDCGINAMVNYTLLPLSRRLNQTEFAIRTASGEIYTTTTLDFERQNYYEYAIIATDRGKFYFYLSNTNII